MTRRAMRRWRAGIPLLALSSAVACGTSGNQDAPSSPATKSPSGSKSSTFDSGSSAPGTDASTLGFDASIAETPDGSMPGDDASPASDAANDASGGDSDALSCTSGPNSTSHQAGYLGDWMAGDYPSDFVSNGNYLTISGVAGQMNNDRQYAVHVPTGYQSGTPVPALFCLHGLGESAASFCLDTGVAWPTKGDQEGFVVIMPNGYQNSWNGGTCCGAAASSGLDDVGLMRAIFAEVGKHVNIDLSRVYATGLSNGGYLSYRLGCEASDLFVAVAPSAGAVGTAAIGGGTQSTSDMTTCAPTHKVSVLDIHGTSDPLIPYATQKPSQAFFQASNGCSTDTASATVPASGGDTTCVTFTGCPTCPSVETTACSVQGGGHCWFGSSDCGTGAGTLGTSIVGNNSNFMKNTDAIWSFFAPLSR
jgi:polyhydroxybutyrate depolymerase